MGRNHLRAFPLCDMGIIPIHRESQMTKQDKIVIGLAFLADIILIIIVFYFANWARTHGQ
jgi:hypothetical protein